MKQPESHLFSVKKRLFVKKWILVLSLLVLSGCSMLSKKVSSTQFVYLSPQLQWQLPELSVLASQFQATQSIQANYGGEYYDLIFQVEKYPDRLVMVAMTPNAQPLLQINYQGGRVEGTVSPLVGDNISMAYLVSDFLLAFGETSAMQSEFQDSGAQLEVSDKRRSIILDNKEIILIDYSTNDSSQWPETVNYQNRALGYGLKITTLSIKGLGKKGIEEKEI